MSKWTKTPFDNLEAACAVAEMLGSDPQPYVGALPPGYEAFTSLDERGRRLLIAQDVGAGGPVRQRLLVAEPVQSVSTETKRSRRRRKRQEPLPVQDPSAPRWSESDRRGVSPWSVSTHFDLGQALKNTQDAVTNPGTLALMKGSYLAVEFPDGDVYEYLEQYPGRVLVRVLSRGTAPPPQGEVTPPVAAEGE